LQDPVHILSTEAILAKLSSLTWLMLLLPHVCCEIPASCV
jgi:hypothetical protein